MTIPAFPLQWPLSRPRLHWTSRKQGRFTCKYRTGRTQAISIGDAVIRLQNELDRIGAHHPVISSNLELRLDGLPRSGQREPSDPGVAVYFMIDGKQTCLPCDTYSEVAQNIAAVAARIQAQSA
jgi:hypothetical protein